MTPLIFSSLGLPEILIIALIVLLFWGGSKIPELMRGMGKGVRSFKEGLNEVEKEVKEVDKEIKDADKVKDSSEAPKE
ncbi:MAG: twin-arginine translocase TatA/TatE family subunit [Bacteroidales bacterium]|nr:twin-arginine translocase TatA/TatE family subunit [Bacteroidales bacterium]